jgi:hypothetical protein
MGLTVLVGRIFIILSYYGISPEVVAGYSKHVIKFDERLITISYKSNKRICIVGSRCKFDLISLVYCVVRTCFKFLKWEC